MSSLKKVSQSKRNLWEGEPAPRGAGEGGSNDRLHSGPWPPDGVEARGWTRASKTKKETFKDRWQLKWEKAFVCMHSKLLALTGYTIFATQRARCCLSGTKPGAEGCKTFPGYSGIRSHPFFTGAKWPTKSNILVDKWLMRYTWVVCKPSSFYVLCTRKMLRWAAVFDKQTSQRLLGTSPPAQIVSGSNPKVALYVAFSSRRGFSLSLCCAPTAH